MITSVNKYPIYNIFSSEANFYYFIPKYQREYVWSYKEWNALYDDICENDLGYFIGSIICINENGDSFDVKLEIIDGQQRLTTISIFLVALYRKIYELKEYLSDDEDDENILPKLRLMLRSKNSENGLKIVPQIQNHNKDDYNLLMFDNGFTKKISPERYKYFGHRKISRCYEQFKYRLSLDIENKSENEVLKILLEKYNKLINSMLVKIEVKSASDAYVLFESLNNRGTPLTAIDLIKNLIMARAGEKSELYYGHWTKLLNYLSEDYGVQERFFRHYYNAFKDKLNEPFRSVNDRKKDPLGIVATKSNLLSIYQRIIDHNLVDFLDDILKCGGIYSILLKPETEGTDIYFKDSFLNLNHIEATPSYILLLFLFRNKNNLGLTDVLIKKIIDLLVVFFVRRNVTDIPGTRDITRILMGIISDINEQGLKGEKLYEYIVSSLKNVCVSDKIFEEKLKGDMYQNNVDATRFLLCHIAQKGMTKETWTDLWKRNERNIYIWTIEHIFPEGENIPQSWVKMIADGDKDLASEYLHKYVHKLGNLTITGYNTELSNYSFEKKRDRMNKDKSKYIGYKNGLDINKELAGKEIWTIDDITNRTNTFVSEIIKEFKL